MSTYLPCRTYTSLTCGAASRIGGRIDSLSNPEVVWLIEGDHCSLRARNTLESFAVDVDAGRLAVQMFRSWEDAGSWNRRNPLQSMEMLADGAVESFAVNGDAGGCAVVERVT